MIFTSIGPDAPFHRAFTPRWAHVPESGAGAALAGGRFNRPGVEARYLAATPETALAEYQGESPLLPPATLVTFLVTAKNVVDFTSGYDPAHWTPIWAEAHGNWKGMAFLEGVEPPSWVIGARQHRHDIHRELRRVQPVQDQRAVRHGGARQASG